MNLVLTVTRNCLEQTKRMVASIEDQDIPCHILFVDNGSTDGTKEWLSQRTGPWFNWKENEGVSRAWNRGLALAFQLLSTKDDPVEHVLVANNDVELAPWTYSLLLSRPPHLPLEDHPDFSLFLIRRDAWQKIGRFDERMKLYASDCDYHIRGFRLGVAMKKAVVPFLHESSATVKHAPPVRRDTIGRYRILRLTLQSGKTGLKRRSRTARSGGSRRKPQAAKSILTF